MQQLQLENTTTLESLSQPNQNQETIGQKSTKNTKCPSRLGDIGEHLVITEALSRGAEVFPNGSSVGKTDLVLEINGQLVKCDVKVKCKNARGYYAQRKVNEIRWDQGVYGITVNPETKKINWYRVGKTKQLRCPNGMEDFWD